MKFRNMAAVFSLALLALPGCRKSASPQATAQPAMQQPTVAATPDMVHGATVSGVVHFKGAPLEQVKIDMGQDPACDLSSSKPNMTEQYLVRDGGLANVFVYIKAGLGDTKFAAPTTPVRLDQKGCRYVPHVIAVMAGQPIAVSNSDMTMHNVHPTPSSGDNHASDITQAAGSPPVNTVFTQPETMIPVRCNNHPWMEAFVNVAANPYYAVTDASGHFEIRGLPPGTYTVGAVHEKMSEQDVTVTVAASGSATADFSFSTH